MDSIVKALRCCVTNYNSTQSRLCNKCPYKEYADGKSGCENKLKADAADAIEELISRLPKWISVDERLPEESGGYIAYIQEPHMIQKADGEEQYDFSFAMQLWFDKQKMLWSDNGEDSYNAYIPAVDTDNAFHVTHWMKLSEPPKGERRLSQ